MLLWDFFLTHGVFAGPEAGVPQTAPSAATSGAGSGQPDTANAQMDQPSSVAGNEGGDNAPQQPLKQDSADANATTGAPDTSQQRSERSAANDTNPFRNLGNALEQWKARLNVTQDTAQEEGAGGGDNEDVEMDAQDGAEYEFLPAQQPGAVDSSAPQTLAAATQAQAEDQAAHLSHAVDGTEDEAGIPDDADAMEEPVATDPPGRRAT